MRNVFVLFIALCSLSISFAITWGNDNILGASVSTGDLYGFSVSLYSNLAVVGAPGALGGDGKAFLFVNTGNWQGLNSTKSGKMFQSPNVNSIENYGYTVAALSNNFLVVSPQNSRPQAFLYYQSVPGVSNWTYYLVDCTASQDVSGYGMWGRSVGFRDTPSLAIIAGSLPLTFNAAGGYGVTSAGLVDEAISSWVTEADHKVYSPANPQENFGWTVEWDKDDPKTLAVASMGSFTTGVAPNIRVSWSWDPFSNVYTFDTIIYIPDSLAYDSGFGYSLKMFTNSNKIKTLIVGAPNATGSTSENNFGVALIYNQTSSTSSFGDPVFLYSPDPHAGDLFGTSVAIYDNLTLVGAPGYGDGGAVFVYKLNSNGSWSYLRQISPSKSGSGFGSAMSLSSNSGAGLWAVIGAPYGDSGSAYIGKVECSTVQYGISCSSCLCSANGVCDYGINGTGLCLNCTSLYWGPTCSQKCSCTSSRPVCLDGPSGNGTCTCPSGFWGPSCNLTCSCVNGTCDTETGTCSSCSYGYWGPLCDNKCSCVNGTCNYGISGDGNCISCSANWFGTICNKQCTCINGTCNNNPPASATGVCSSCFAVRNGISYYGPNCDKLCACKFGNCNQTTGQCASCLTSFYGSNCSGLCTCKYGTCNDGLTGNGLCSSCNTNGPYGNNIFGPNCTECTCKNGQCSSGFSGTGTCVGSCIGNWDGVNCDYCTENWAGSNCSSCSKNQWGANCSNQCTCVNGQCNSGISGNGKCSSCSYFYWGPDCTKSCLNCSSKSCDYGPTGSGICICPGQLPYNQME